MKSIAKRWWQKGAVLALSALLLPMIVVGTGLAVDLGNVYVQYSRLQNAADAAALAGAHEYAVKGDTLANHGNADKMAKKYIKGEYHNLDENEENVDYNDDSFMAGKADDAVYYRVKLVKKVPLYFLGSIKKSVDVTAVSIASMQGGATNNSFKNLFIFKDGFSATNTVNDLGVLKDNAIYDDLNRGKNMISDVFDGRIVYTKGDGINNPSYYPKENIRHSVQTEGKEFLHPLDRFYTSYGKKKNKDTSIKVLMSDKEKDNPVAKFDDNGELQSGNWSKAGYYNYKFQTFYDFVRDKAKDCKNIADDQNIYTDSNLFKSDVIVVPNTNRIPNVNITVNKKLGDSDVPIYVYIKSGMGVVNIKLDTDTGRPLIICIDGDDNNRPQVTFALNGHTFKGVIYAPYCKAVKYGDRIEGLLVNATNSTFIGTIVTSYLNLNGDHCTYKYKDYVGGSSGAGSTSSVSADGISLVSPPDGIKWQ